jgi:uncharacterized protein (DUF697 family)
LVRLAAARLPRPVPRTEPESDTAARRCRTSVKKRALLSATAAVVPIPGLDLAVDLGMMMQMMDDINAEFGLTGAQIDAMAPADRMTTHKAITAVGSSLIGRVITREALTVALRSVAKRLLTAGTVKYVPLAGQAMAAGISYVALKYVGNRHIEDCVAVAEILAGQRDAHIGS